MHLKPSTRPKKGRLPLVFFFSEEKFRFAKTNLRSNFRLERKPQVFVYIPVNQHSNGKWTLWRCITYWKWGYSIAMLVYRRVFGFNMDQKEIGKLSQVVTETSWLPWICMLNILPNGDGKMVIYYGRIRKKITNKSTNPQDFLLVLAGIIPRFGKFSWPRIYEP